MKISDLTDKIIDQEKKISEQEEEINKLLSSNTHLSFYLEEQTSSCKQKEEIIKDLRRTIKILEGNVVQ